MKNPFTLLKQVFQKEKLPPQINKPVEQVKQERKEVKIPEKKCDHSSPRFESQVLADKRKKRRIINRMQRISRKINRN